MTGAQTVLLRSYIAASNTVSLRELTRTNNPVTTNPFNPPTPVGVGLYTASATVNGTPQDVAIRVYRHTPQPFLTEVYASTDTVTPAPNPEGYIAIELYNPYPYEIDFGKIPLRIGRIARTQGIANYPLKIEEVATVANGIIEAGGYALLENLDDSDPTGNAAQHRPPATGLPPNGPVAANKLTVIPVANLSDVFDHEMVLLLGGTAGSPLVNDYDARPIDSYDFSGFKLSDPLGVRQMHYARPSGDRNRWKFVYPGRYDGSQLERRQQGTQFSDYWAPPGVGTDLWDPAAGASPPHAPPPNSITLGGTSNGIGLPNDNPDGSYEAESVFTIPMMNDYPMLHPLPNPAPNGPLLKYPFGMFARNCDMLQIPFIGSYRIDLLGVGAGSDSLIEMNPITMDAAFAEDTFTDDDPGVVNVNGDYWHEQIGRFCPIPGVGPSASTVDDFATNSGMHAYAFATKLFDYFTVQSPGADYLPAISPNWARTNGSSGYGINNLPQPVEDDGDGTAADEDYDTANGTPAPKDVGKEDTLPIHGLVNINTAPWPVLASIPFLPGGRDALSIASDGQVVASPNQTDDNIDLARAIVYWRDVNDGGGTPGGPFKSIFELYRVPAFRAIQRAGYTDDSAADPGPDQGDFYPVIPGDVPDGVRRDFKEFYLLLNRVSNLITTRSDSFTVYLVVQGWRGVGSAKPELVVQRRAAFIQDRSGLTLSNPNLPAPINVPND